MNPKKINRPARVQMYFGVGREQVYKDLVALSDITHRSASDIAFACFVSVFYDEQMRDSILRGSGVSAVDLKKSKKK
jgi:hypothetical protein